MSYRSLPPAWAVAVNFSPTESAGLDGEVDDLYSGLRPASSSPIVYPMREEVFRAFHEVEPADIRMVILGQDPYPQSSSPPGRGIADGLAFSAPGHRPPGSLRQLIYNLWESGEIEVPPGDGNLQRWADQDVLVLNTALSVEPHPNQQIKDHNRRRHQAIYRPLIRRALRHASMLRRPPAFLLLGAEAQKFRREIAISDPDQVINAQHPGRGDWPGPSDPLDPFVAANRFLGARSIDWRLA